MEQPQVVITMTSWKGRIHVVGKCIYYFFTRQTEKPDVFYLWLSAEEFPNRENDLPADLLAVIDAFGVRLCWTETNEYIYKRWNIYPQHYSDMVISIDDDILFDSRLVEVAKKHLSERNVVYGIFKDLMYQYAFVPGNTRNYNLEEPLSLRYRWLGCSVICPNSFPMEAMSDENKVLRDKICRRCDETWLKPFSLMNDTKIGYLDFEYKHSLVYGALQNKDATWYHLYKSYDGFMVRDYQLWVNLYHFPEHLERFKQVFPDYNAEFYEKKGIDFCLGVLRENDA